MIAALYQSRTTGGKTNCFQCGKKSIAFGWESLEGMLNREIKRKMDNQLPRVPGLKENYIYRDSWTHLNVNPAKTMQVCWLVYYIMYCQLYI